MNNKDNKVLFYVGRLAYTPGDGFWPNRPYKSHADAPGIYETTIFVDKEEFKSNAAYGAEPWAYMISRGNEFHGTESWRKPGEDGDKSDKEWKHGKVLIKFKNNFGPIPIVAPDNNPMIENSPLANQLLYVGQNVLIRCKPFYYNDRSGGKGCRLNWLGLKVLGGGEKIETSGGDKAGIDDLAKHTPAGFEPEPVDPTDENQSFPDVGANKNPHDINFE